MSIEIRDDIALAIWRVSGNVPMNLMIEYTERYINEGAFRAGMHVLSLNTMITSSYNRSELDALGACIHKTYGQLNANIQCASVFSDEVQFGLARMFEITFDSKSMDFHPFRDLSDAKTWLGLAEDCQISLYGQDGGRCFCDLLA